MYQGFQPVCAYFLAPFRIRTVWGFPEGFSRHFSQFTPILFDKSSIAKINRLSAVNDVSVGSPSRMRMVRRISLGITTRPRSSIRLTIPVAFIYKNLLITLVGDGASTSRFEFEELLRAIVGASPYRTKLKP